MGKKPTNFLTTRQLAVMWQVSEATIKRWADAGHLRSQKTMGGHRRFALDEVLGFQSERGLGERGKKSRAACVSAASGASKKLKRRDALECFFIAISGGHESEAASVLLKQHLDKLPLVKILEETLAEAMHRVGDHWHEGQMSVADEHLATRTAIRALESLRETVRPARSNGLLAISCAAEDELHDIAALCVQMLLESAGWSVMNLGANTPFYALSDAILKHRPRLVCVSSATGLALARYAHDYAQFQTIAQKHQTRIVLGGAGFCSPATAQRFPAELHAENFRQLLKLIN